MGVGRFSSTVRSGLLAVVWVSCAIGCRADGPATEATAEDSGLYVKVQLDHGLNLSKLKPGDTVQGKLAREVYRADRELFPAASAVRLTVDHVEKRRKGPNDHWPWVVKAFTPRYEKYPVFKTATISSAKGEAALSVSLISISRRREVYAHGNHKPTGEAGAVEVRQADGIYGSKKSATPMLVLEAFGIENDGTFGDASGDTARAENDSAAETLPSGTNFKILLLAGLSASRSRAGDKVQARLLEPVFVNSHLVLPAGTLIEGKVLKQTPPRWGSRAGSLSLAFTGVTLPGGNFFPVAASLAAVELERSSHTKIDAEGRLRGERPGKAWMAINLGATAGLAKAVDDGTQVIVEALISTATDASTAGTARIVSSCISGIYMVTRHGRDVVLPRFTEMNIVLDRPLSVPKKAEPAASSALLPES